MKELEFINIIKQQTNSEFLGDDCAYIKDLKIVITQDSLVEDVHFKMDWITSYQLGYKSVTVNISDVLASGAEPAYITIALSLPKNIDDNFIKEFYRGANDALYGAKIVGGDITGSDKIFVSICAIGKTEGRKISSRKNAKPDYVVITYGDYGLSSAGLKELMQGGSNQELIKAHLEPKLSPGFSESIACNINDDYAMMDTSDGLADALFKIAEASGVTILANYVEGMFCAEDYNLVAAVPKSFLNNLQEYRVIGKVVEFNGNILEIEDKKYNKYEGLKVYDHFGGDDE